MENGTHSPESADDGATQRRNLLKLGVYAAYTAPALLAMATAAKAQGASPVGICNPFEGPCP